LLNEKYL